MANNHIISIEREARLSVDLGRLKICFPSDNTAHYIAFIDIAVPTAVIIIHILTPQVEIILDITSLSLTEKPSILAPLNTNI